jgi:putative restriction endonuclease
VYRGKNALIQNKLELTEFQHQRMVVQMSFRIEDYINEIDQMNLNMKDGKPALKKPLLLLLLISRFESGYYIENKIHYLEIEKELTFLIENYGGRPSVKGAKAYHPFQYLSSSDFWNLMLPVGVKMTNSRDLPLRIIKNDNTYAILDEDLFINLKESRRTRARLANFILAKWWTKNIQEDIRSVLNLPFEVFDQLQKDNNKDFSKLVVENFNNKCACCGFSAVFNHHSFGNDGVHIKWLSQGGPNTVDNGLSLCKFHSWTFDRGVISINPNNLEILVSSKFSVQDDVSTKTIMSLKGQKLLPYKDVRPNSLFLEWHFDSIFIE